MKLTYFSFYEYQGMRKAEQNNKIRDIFLFGFLSCVCGHFYIQYFFFFFQYEFIILTIIITANRDNSNVLLTQINHLILKLILESMLKLVR